VARKGFFGLGRRGFELGEKTGQFGGNQKRSPEEQVGSDLDGKNGPKRPRF